MPPIFSITFYAFLLWRNAYAPWNYIRFWIMRPSASFCARSAVVTSSPTGS